tara:strand:- start:37 stop:1209 length:1173 start_codon:yes stop_codon:yes gene_type:complete
MNYKVFHPSKTVNCDIDLPSSKSISNRLLIIQALCEKSFKIINISNCDDSKSLRKALNFKENIINIGYAGTAFRFLTSYLSVQSGKKFILTGSDRIKKRPIKELVKVLRKIGARIEYMEREGFAPLKIIGTELEGGGVEISGGISSQFISSILLIAPTLKNGIELKIKGELVSKSYLEMTLKLMREFGIKSSWKNNIIKIQSQNYLPIDYTVEADWSAASFWFEIASLSESCKIKLNGLNQNTIQGDIKAIEIFKHLGVNSKFENKKLILTKNKDLNPQSSYDLLDNPDVYQALRCSLFGLNRSSDFVGIVTLKDKETNRIFSVSTELEKLHSSKIINTYKDHRMAMSFAPLCLRYGELQINDAEVVTKSYPNFWKDLKKSGFIISVLSH